MEGKHTKEWVEIGNLMFKFTPWSVRVRAVIYGDRADVFRGGDFILNVDEFYELYKMLKQIIEHINAEKRCAHCIHYKMYGCKHPGGGNIESECNKTGKQYFEPKYRI